MDQILDSPGQAGTKRKNPASFGERLVAIIIDTVILSIVNFGISAAILSSGDPTSPAAILFPSLLYWVYFAGFESSGKQATLGKMAMGIIVTDLQGNKVSFLKATGRHFGKFVSGIILLIGYFMMIWDDNSQTLHDKMAGCYVVRSK